MAKELKVPGEYQSRTPRSKQNIISKETERVYTEQDYKNYMRVINYKIWETEELLEKYLERMKISRLTFEQWVQWQKGELNWNDVKKISNDKTI
jgi:hypothetical protein